MPFNPVRSFIKATKVGAAIRQLEAAIDAFEVGDYACAVTLAGAAEGMLPEIPSQPLFAALRDHPNAPLKGKEWVAMLNSERDWLKHTSQGTIGPVIVIETNDAAVMVLRAMAKIPDPWSDRLETFKAWATENGFGPDPLAGKP